MEGAGQAVAGDEFRFEVGGLRLEFLHADDVGVLRGQPVEEAFAGSGADAVEVGRYNSHRFLTIQEKPGNVRLQSRVCGVCHRFERAVFWRVQDQGRGA
jgi:hypothetical protein